MNDGDWICNEQNCGNINFARRTSCYRCNAEKPESEKASKKKLGTEIGKSAAEKSRGLFNADDWQCNKCANVNWARRTTCNVCNAPKFGEVEARTGYGGGYNERGVVEYRRREGSSDDEYDEFGRKKRKQQRSENEDKVGITEGAELKNLLPKPQKELKVRNCMSAPAAENKIIAENVQLKGRFSDGPLYSDSLHSVSTAASDRDNQTSYQSAAYKQNMKNMHSNRLNSFYQNRQNRKRNTNFGDTHEYTGSSGYETGTKKARKDSSDSPVFMSFNPVMENMVTSTNEVAYKYNRAPFNASPQSNVVEVKYTIKEKVLAAAFAIAYNNCKISSERFESLLDKPAPDFKTIFDWRQRLLATGCLDDAHEQIKTSNIQVKSTKVSNPDEIAIITSESEEECTKSQLPNKPALQIQQRSDSVETVLLERVEKGTQGANPSVETLETKSSHGRNHSKTSHKGSSSSSSDSRSSDSSDYDSEHFDLKSTKSKTKAKSGVPAIASSARQSAMDSDSESVSYHSEQDNFLSRKFGENKKVRRKFKRRNTVPPPATCSTPETPVTCMPPITQPQTNATTILPYQGYCTAKPVEISPLTTGNFYTPNLRNMNAKAHGATGDLDSGSSEYVPTRLGATAKNNYQDFKNNVRLNRPGYWARANGATLSTKRKNTFQGTSALGQQNKSSLKRCISSYIPPVDQPNPNSARVPEFGETHKSIESQKSSCISGLDAPNKSPMKNHVNTYIPGFCDPNKSPVKRAISSFIPIEAQKNVIPGLTELDKSPVKRHYSSFSGFYDSNQSQKQSNCSIPGINDSSPIKQKSSFIPGLEAEKIQSYVNSASTNCQIVQHNSYNKNNVDFTQDDLDTSITEDHYLPFDKPKKTTRTQSDQGSLDLPPKQGQRGDQYGIGRIPLPKKPSAIDKIPLPEKPSENTDRIFAVVQDNFVDRNRSITDIFDNGSAGKGSETNNELEEYENVKKPFETEWDADDDALYGESGNATLDDNNMETNQALSPQNNMTNASNQLSPVKQTDLLKEKKEILMGMLQSMQMDNENKLSPQYKNRAQQSSANDQLYDHAHPSNAMQVPAPVNDLAKIPEPIPLEITQELILMSKDDDNDNSSDKCNIENASQNKIDEASQQNVKDSKRIHVIESVTIEPRKNRKQSKQHPQLDLMPVTVIQPEIPTTTENIEILESSDDQEPPAPPLPQTAAAVVATQPLGQTDLTSLLAGINANTLMLALQNLQQLANNSQNSSFSSTQNNPEPEQENCEPVAQPVDTINLTNDEWEKESVGESIERQLEAMDGNPAATPFLSDILFDPAPVLQNVTRKLNINLKSPVDKSDVQKPDENALVIGNFKSFALPKPPRLNRVKVPIKSSSKKKRSDGKRKRKKKKAGGSQDEAAEDEEESGDEADLAKYDLWGSEDENSKTGSSSKTAGSSTAGSKSKDGESSKTDDPEDKNGKVDSPASKNSSKNSSKKSRSRSRSSSSSSSSTSSSSSESQSSSQSASGSPKNKFDDFNLNSEREMSPRPRNSRSPRPRISAPLPRRKSHDSRGSNGDSRSHEPRDKEWSRDRERRGERSRGSRSGDRKERRYSRDGAHYPAGARGRHR